MKNNRHKVTQKWPQILKFQLLIGKSENNKIQAHSFTSFAESRGVHGPVDRTVWLVIEPD